MGIIRNIANLFKSTDAKLERIGAIEFELEQLQEVKDLVVDQYNTLSKAVSCEDFMCKEEIRFTDKDYIRQLASLKSTEKSLLKELDILKSNEDVIHRYDDDKRAEAVKIVKSLYRSGKLDLSQYNHAAAEKDENGAVKYADVIVLTDSWELLLMKRSNFEDKHQGAFVIPGGHVDKGEDYETAAKRELLEETGISVDKLKADEHLKDITFHKVGEFMDKNAHIEYYLLRINNKEQVEILLDELETRDYKWIPREEIDNYPMVFNMKDNIKEIMGWDLLPNLKVIEKAFELGIIPADVLEKARAHKYVSREGVRGDYRYTYDDSRNKLYHVTSTSHIFDILGDNKVKQGGNYFGVSLTRNKNYAVRGVSDGDVILVLDKESLNHNKKIIPRADLNAKHSSKTGTRSEAEERVEGDIELGKSLLEIRISKFNFDKYTNILEDSKKYLEDLRNSKVNLPEDIRLLRIKSYEKRLEFYGKLVNHPKLLVMDDIRKSFLEEIEKSFNSTSEEYLKGQVSDELYNEAKGKYDIEKGKKANLGETRLYSGVEYKKISETGNPNKDWVRTGNKEKKMEDIKAINEDDILEKYDCKLDKYQQRYLDDVKTLKREYEDYEIKYNKELCLFKLNMLMNELVYPKVEWQDDAVKQKVIEEKDKYEGKKVFDDKSIGDVLRQSKEYGVPLNISLMEENLTKEEYDKFKKPIVNILDEIILWDQKEKEFRIKYELDKSIENDIHDVIASTAEEQYPIIKPTYEQWL